MSLKVFLMIAGAIYAGALIWFLVTVYLEILELKRESKEARCLAHYKKARDQQFAAYFRAEQPGGKK